MNDHKLIIMRHAKSDWSTGAATDFERPLAPRGGRDAPRMGKWLRRSGLMPDLLLSSPALRARQTASLVAEKLGYPDDRIVWCEEIYEATLGTLLEVLEQQAGTHSTLLLVGHNPGLDCLLEYLSRDPPVLYNGKLMVTAAVAALNFGGAGFSTAAHSAGLEYLMRPKQLPKK